MKTSSPSSPRLSVYSEREAQANTAAAVRVHGVELGGRRMVTVEAYAQTAQTVTVRTRSGGVLVTLSPGAGDTLAQTFETVVDGIEVHTIATTIAGACRVRVWHD